MRVTLEFEIYDIGDEQQAMDILEDIEDWPRMYHGHTIRMDVDTSEEKGR